MRRDSHKTGKRVSFAMKRSTAVFFDCVKKNRAAILLFAAILLLNGAVFYLYGILAEPFFYSALLLAALLLMLIGADFVSELKKAGRRERTKNTLLACGVYKPEDGSLRDADYTEMLALLTGELQRLQTEISVKRQADDDYYTAWVHQIKTPIATMKLQLAEDTEGNRAIRAELFRVEQYVEMVLDYIRLDSASNDLVVASYDLDSIIKETLRKIAPQFVLRKLKLNYTPAGITVVTDKKWLAFILEQLLSNALKYTPAGEIGLEAQGNEIRVSDTGIGIAPEDLPRIFEKGYTGMNGRIGENSSGLGLFLTKKAADLLGIAVSCESAVGQGTTFTLTLPEKR